MSASEKSYRRTESAHLYGISCNSAFLHRAPASAFFPSLPFSGSDEGGLSGAGSSSASMPCSASVIVRSTGRCCASTSSADWPEDMASDNSTGRRVKGRKTCGLSVPNIHPTAEERLLLANPEKADELHSYNVPRFLPVRASFKLHIWSGEHGA